MSFRLSPEEYDSLKNVSASRGAHSVSEFTRSVACVNTGSGGTDMMEEILRLINDKMDTIDRQLKRLAELYEELERTATSFREEKPR